MEHFDNTRKTGQIVSSWKFVKIEGSPTCLPINEYLPDITGIFILESLRTQFHLERGRRARSHALRWNVVPDALRPYLLQLTFIIGHIDGRGASKVPSHAERGNKEKLPFNFRTDAISGNFQKIIYASCLPFCPPSTL